MTRKRKRASLGNTFLILGPCNTGKTALFYRLNSDIFTETVSSLEPHDILMDISHDALPNYSENALKKKIRVVDFPGHPRLRWKLSEYIKDVRIIVFLIDASSISPAKNAKETAEYLYDIFVSCIKAKRKPRMLIACNKVDVGSDSSDNIAQQKNIDVETIKQTLSTHLDVLKTTRHSLSSEGETDGILLGVESLPFSFENDSGLDVEFATISIKSKLLEPLSTFMSKSY